jgi:hypothetical protein
LKQTDVSEMRIASIIRVITLMMEAVRTSETSVYAKENKRHYLPQGSHVHTRQRVVVKNISTSKSTELDYYQRHGKEHVLRN